MENFPEDQGPSLSYSYTALSEAYKEIRLIRLLSSFGSENVESPVHCEIITTPLEKAPEYQALSYVWGSRTNTKELHVGEKLLQVTSNLDTALRHLCLSTQPPPGLLWIDAISINQEDEEEKSWQVTLMRSIYASASCTLSWIGPCSPTLSFAIETINEVDASLNSPMRRGFRRLLPFKKSEPDDALYRFALKYVEGDSKLRSEAFDSVEELLRLEYFRRVWILQEVLVAKNATIICGPLRLPWMKLHTVLLAHARKTSQHHLLNGTGAETLTEFARRLRKGGVLRSLPMPSVFWLGARQQSSTKKETLETLIWHSKKRLVSSEPMDYIYALLGLVNPDHTISLTSDYSITTEECYVETAKRLLLCHGLGVISMASYQKVLPDLPSWVPDFSAPWVGEASLLAPTRVYLEASVHSTTCFNVSKDSTPSLRFTKVDSREVLVAAGFAISRVIGCLGAHRADEDWVQSDDTDDNKHLFQLNYVLHYIARFFQNHGFSIEDESRKAMFGSIARTARRDREPGRGISKLSGETFSADVALLNSLWCESEESIKKQDATVSSKRGSKRSLNGEKYGLRARALVKALKYPLFLTVHGLGRGMRQVQTGDTIAVFHGAKVPYVLRPRGGNSYHLLCEAYVDGIMYGAAFEENSTATEFYIT